MTKSTKKLITLINGAVILLLLIFSAVILFIANSPQKDIFGKEIRIISNVNTLNDKTAENYLVALTKKPNIKKGSLFLYNCEDGLFIAKANSIKDKIISYSSKDKKDELLSLDDEKFVGQISYKSKFFGNLFTAIASKENISLSFIFIFGIFVISMLSLVIAYMLYSKRLQENPTDILPSTSENIQPNESLPYIDDEIDEVEQLELLYTPPLPLKEEETNVQTEETAQITKKTVTVKISEEENQTGYTEMFDKIAKELSAPPYSLSDNDVPSIDSIIASIDRQFDDLDDTDDTKDTKDEDIKIFSPKKNN